MCFFFISSSVWHVVSKNSYKEKRKVVENKKKKDAGWKCPLLKSVRDRAAMKFLWWKW